MDEPLLTRAFDVREITSDFDPSIQPANGHEYLQHVMYEASKCPQVVVAKIDTRKLKSESNNQSSSEFPLVKSELVPSIEWQRAQIAMFSDLRKKVQLCRKSDKFKPVSLPKANEEEKWQNICCGNSNEEPLLTLLLSMNEPLLARVLEYHGEWLDDGLQPNQGKWLYALLACLDLPLTSVTCSAVRDVAKKCTKIRCSKKNRRPLDKDENSKSIERLHKV
ncbi:hypothetical protein RUM44_007185 [Polyplax serrata]|uniref:Gem-associated protein 2 n=1 Tax=Polyplax serrata TaxID=468196 RepID=A0ABR1B000_POLSC